MLAGSVHVRGEKTPIPPVILAACEQASRVVFESRFDAERDRDLGSLPGQTTLGDILDRELLEELRATCLELGAKFETFIGLRPWAVAFDLDPFLARHFGAEANFGLDHLLLDKARAEGKEIQALEQVDFVARRLNAGGYGLQTQLLRDFLQTKRDGVEGLRTLTQAWVTGDVARLEAVVAENFATFPELYDLLLHQRNRNWLSRLREYRRMKAPTLAVVGCFHLVGPGNLRDLLAAKGAVFEQL